MVAAIVGVVNVVPEPRAVPPVKVAYQLIEVPALPVAPNVVVPVPQRVFGVVETTELAKFNETGFENAGVPLQATILQRYCVATVGITLHVVAVNPVISVQVPLVDDCH